MAEKKPLEYSFTSEGDLEVHTETGFRVYRRDRSASEVLWWWMKRSVIAAVFFLGIGMAGCPVYNVWNAKMKGEAAIALQTRQGQAYLAQAQSARMVAVTQAEAEREAASKRAEAIAIVGKAAQDFPQYRTQEFIGAFAEAMHAGRISQIIYVPTEANIPILEVGRRPDGARH